MDTSVHVNTHAAEGLTLEDALQRYSREGLKGKPGQCSQGSQMIRSQSAQSLLSAGSIYAYRDLLSHTGWLANVNSAIERLDDDPAGRVSPHFAS
jgi:hypothetical protein